MLTTIFLALVLAGAPPAPPGAPDFTEAGPSPETDDSAAPLHVEAICRRDDECFFKVTKREGSGKQIAVTTFRANRVGPDMKYFKGDEDGSVDNPDAGLMYLEHPVAYDEFGALRRASPSDPPDSVFTLTMNTGIDPKGRATFFYGYLHRERDPFVHRSYLWGYPPTTVKNIGSIGGPRSPVVPRNLPALRPIQGGVSLSLLIDSDAENRCWVTAVITRGAQQGRAATTFRANELGEDLRYFPAEKKGGTDLLGASATFAMDLDVVVGPHGAMRRAEAGDERSSVDTLSATVALDERGHVTFFYGFIRVPEASYVRRFYLWGYPPETLMVDDAREGDGGSPGRGTRKRDS